MKKLIFLILAIMITAGAVIGCSAEADTMTALAASPEPTLEIDFVGAEEPEPVISQPDVRLAELPDGYPVPSGYTRINMHGIEHTVYAFSDSTGQTQFRMFAEYDVLKDGTKHETVQGFVQADITASEETRAEFKLLKKPTGPMLIDTESEDFGKAVKADIAADDVPPGYIGQFAENMESPYVLSFTNIYGETEYRVPASFGKPAENQTDDKTAASEESETTEGALENQTESMTHGFYAADAAGNVLPGALLTDYDVEMSYVLTVGSEPVEKPAASLPAVYVIIGSKKYPVHPATVTENEFGDDEDKTTGGEKSQPAPESTVAKQPESTPPPSPVQDAPPTQSATPVTTPVPAPLETPQPTAAPAVAPAPTPQPTEPPKQGGYAYCSCGAVLAESEYEAHMIDHALKEESHSYVTY